MIIYIYQSICESFRRWPFHHGEPGKWQGTKHSRVQSGILSSFSTRDSDKPCESQFFWVRSWRSVRQFSPILQLVSWFLVASQWVLTGLVFLTLQENILEGMMKFLSPGVTSCSAAAPKKSMFFFEWGPQVTMHGCFNSKMVQWLGCLGVRGTHILGNPPVG